MQLYKLIQHYNSPFGDMPSGIVFTEKDWILQIKGLEKGDCKLFTNWFLPVKAKYEHTDVIQFAEFCLRKYAGAIPEKNIIETFRDYYKKSK